MYGLVALLLAAFNFFVIVCSAVNPLLNGVTWLPHFSSYHNADALRGRFFNIRNLIRPKDQSSPLISRLQNDVKNLVKDFEDTEEAMTKLAIEISDLNRNVGTEIEKLTTEVMSFEQALENLKTENSNQEEKIEELEELVKKIEEVDEDVATFKRNICGVAVGFNGVSSKLDNADVKDLHKIGDDAYCRQF